MVTTVVVEGREGFLFIPGYWSPLTEDRNSPASSVPPLSFAPGSTVKMGVKSGGLTMDSEAVRDAQQMRVPLGAHLKSASAGGESSSGLRMFLAVC